MIPKERLEQITGLLLKYSVLDFSEKATIVGDAGEADAIAAGLNILIEELQSSMLKEKKLMEEVKKLNQELEKKIEEKTTELSKSEKLFRSLIEKNADMMTLALPDGKLLYASPSLTSVLGFTSEDFFARPAFEFIHPEDVPGLIEQMMSIMETPGASFYRQQRLLHKDGTYRWCEGTVTNMLHDPTIGALVSNFRDITNRKNAEEAKKEQMEGLEQMIYLTSHKVSQPVAHILGVSNLLEKDDHSYEELKKIGGYYKESALALDKFTQELTLFIHNMKLKAGN